MSDKAKQIGAMFRQAHESGDLSAAALQALTICADMGMQIQAGLGIAPDDVPTSEVVLVSVMPDDSQSIRSANNADLVSEGHNLILEALRASKQSASILAHNRYLNGNVLYPYVRLEDALPMDRSNYDPSLSTPLYDQTAVLLGTVLAKTREFEDTGVSVRTVTLIITDGADCGSCQQTKKSVRSIVEDMLRKEQHIVAALGINDGSTDFKRVFRDMGIRDEWILTTRNSDKEIRRAFQVFSQSAVRVSSGAVAGGFGC